MAWSLFVVLVVGFEIASGTSVGSLVFKAGSCDSDCMPSCPSFGRKIDLAACLSACGCEMIDDGIRHEDGVSMPAMGENSPNINDIDLWSIGVDVHFLQDQTVQISPVTRDATDLQKAANGKSSGRQDGLRDNTGSRDAPPVQYDITQLYDPYGQPFWPMEYPPWIVMTQMQKQKDTPTETPGYKTDQVLSRKASAPTLNDVSLYDNNKVDLQYGYQNGNNQASATYSHRFDNGAIVFGGGNWSNRGGMGANVGFGWNFMQQPGYELVEDPAVVRYTFKQAKDMPEQDGAKTAEPTNLMQISPDSSSVVTDDQVSTAQLGPTDDSGTYFGLGGTILGVSALLAAVCMLGGHKQKLDPGYLRI